MALAFVLYRSPDLRLALQQLAVPVSVAAVPILLSGAVVHRRLELAPAEASPTSEDSPAPRGLEPALARTVKRLLKPAG